MRTGTRTPVAASRTQYTFPRRGRDMLAMAAAAAVAARLRVLPALAPEAARLAALSMALRPVRLALRSKARAARMAVVLRCRRAMRRRRLLARAYRRASDTTLSMTASTVETGAAAGV